jgi:hypothetical protein
MIKVIKEVMNHELRMKILKRFDSHQEFQTFCRYILDELKQLARYENQMPWSSIDAQLAFRNKLTQAEVNFIDIIIRNTRKS